jgi:SAM-dependent methyltransferase
VTETEQTVPVEDLLRRLRNAPIPVETVPGRPVFDDGGQYTWQKDLVRGRKPRREAGTALEVPFDPAPVDEAFLNEVHHRQTGRPWALGKYIFDFALARGLRPEHKLLDVGCGALRFGVRAIAYLDEGNYFGVDSHLKSLEAGATYEIPLHGLEHKRPRLLWDETFTFTHFETEFDWAMDFMTSVHISSMQVRQLFGGLAKVLRPGARVLSSPPPRVKPAIFDRLGFRRVHEETQQCPLLDGHGFVAANEWGEFVFEPGS